MQFSKSEGCLLLVIASLLIELFGNSEQLLAFYGNSKKLFDCCIQKILCNPMFFKFYNVMPVFFVSG